MWLHSHICCSYRTTLQGLKPGSCKRDHPSFHSFDIEALHSLTPNTRPRPLSSTDQCLPVHTTSETPMFWSLMMDFILTSVIVSSFHLIVFCRCL